jgi:hypothetical protein
MLAYVEKKCICASYRNIPTNRFSESPELTGTHSSSKADLDGFGDLGRRENYSL